MSDRGHTATIYILYSALIIFLFSECISVQSVLNNHSSMLDFFVIFGVSNIFTYITLLVFFTFYYANLVKSLSIFSLSVILGGLITFLNLWYADFVHFMMYLFCKYYLFTTFFIALILSRFTSRYYAPYIIYIKILLTIFILSIFLVITDSEINITNTSGCDFDKNIALCILQIVFCILQVVSLIGHFPIIVYLLYKSYSQLNKLT